MGNNDILTCAAATLSVNSFWGFVSKYMINFSNVKNVVMFL